jgi:hypothetical protein
MPMVIILIKFLLSRKESNVYVDYTLEDLKWDKI